MRCCGVKLIAELAGVELLAKLVRIKLSDQLIGVEGGSALRESFLCDK